jgi:2-dehydro-3-deoxygluconokinase
MSPSASRVVCVGEGMVEISPHHGGWHVHHGGDTLNAALHFTRLGHSTAYLTALGSDPFAGRMRAEWAREGMDVSLVLAHPKRTTGLYAIATDATGERHFSYWRGESAARALFLCDGIERAETEARTADLLFFSLISLAILPEEGRARLLSLAKDVRARGATVAFDSNYRPALWENREAAQRWRDRAIAAADIGLPTVEDDRALGTGETAQEIAAHWRQGGVTEVLVKLGAEGCLLPDGSRLAPPTQLVPLDTSGAGDAFDAGYLAARLRGLAPAEAARDGQKLAAWTVMRQGAIPPRDHAAPYGEMVNAAPE